MDSAIEWPDYLLLGRNVRHSSEKAHDSLDITCILRRSPLHFALRGVAPKPRSSSGCPLQTERRDLESCRHYGWHFDRNAPRQIQQHRQAKAFGCEQDR